MKLDRPTRVDVRGHRGHEELAELFVAASAALVYVTAIPDRSTMARCLIQIAWETEARVADARAHFIHFNGDGFLGPYGSPANRL